MESSLFAVDARGDELDECFRVSFERAKVGRSFRSAIVVGLFAALRKSALDRAQCVASDCGAVVVRMDASCGRSFLGCEAGADSPLDAYEARPLLSLPALLAPALERALLAIGEIDGAQASASLGLSALAGFTYGLKPAFDDIEAYAKAIRVPGLADNGDLDSDLGCLLEQVGLASRAANSALVMVIDNLDWVDFGQMGSLISALHRIGQLRLPVVLVGSGRPSLLARMSASRSYAERMFDFSRI